MLETNLSTKPAWSQLNLVDHPQTPEQLRAKAEALWQLLDDISTCFDMYKPKMFPFEDMVRKLCEKRSRHFESDGYKLFATKSQNEHRKTHGTQ